MVWFQCEDCGENLKKPKLQAHFKICSADKLSCIDCGVTFDQQSVQHHTQCISEAEKYGPKGQGTASNAKPAKPKDTEPKQNLDIDVNVGLSSNPPWICSLCNTKVTSKQTLLSHAEGKKHKAKARAFHASQQKSSQTEQSTANEKDAINGHSDGCSTDERGIKSVDEEKVRDPPEVTVEPNPEAGKESPSMKKRKSNMFECGDTGNTYVGSNRNDGEVIQAESGEAGPEGQLKRKKQTDPMENGTLSCSMVATSQKMKWKKLIASILKLDPDGSMKIKKLQRLVSKALKDAGIAQDESQLQDILMHKINSSSRFIHENKLVRLAHSPDATV